MEKIRILVVEDEAITAYDLQASLIQLGYEVPAIVSTGEDAIRSAVETHPDLILMDIILDGRMSGIEAAAVIRQSTAIPVIFVTAADDISTITHAKRVEPYGYLTKPYQISLLQSTIETALYKHKMDSRLRESEERRRTILQTAMDGFWMVDMQGRILEVNETYCLMSGYTSQELLGMHISDLEAVETPDDIATRIRSLAEQGQERFETRHRRKNGSTFDIESSIKYLDLEGGRIVAFLRDITDRRRTEEALRASEERYRLIIEQSPYAICIHQEGKYVFVNDAAVTLFGAAGEQQLLGVPILDTVDPAYRELVKARVRSISKQNVKTNGLEEKLLRFDGSTFMAEISGVPVVFNGKPAIQAVIRDITERKQTEEKIRRSEEFVRSILDTVDEGFIVIDRDYRIRTANKAYCRQVGGCDTEIVGRHCYEVSHKNTRRCFEEGEDCAPCRAFETGESCTLRHRHKDAHGNMLYFETRAFPIKDASGAVTSVIETINNITEKHLLEEERLKTQKLESIGTLAGGIAHDFNNLLQGVFGYISLAKMTAENPGKCTGALEQAEKALHQSVNLTTQLLTFSRGGKPLKKPVDLLPVIESAARFTLSGSRSDLRLDIPKDLWQTEADAGQLGQVIQNLVLNADQSMPVGGTVKVIAANSAKGDPSLPPGLAPGDYIMIAIRDTGVGIPDQYLGRIFDPYFTTKEKGSGLGLATSYSIIRNHGGMIDVKTKSGVGSVFTIYLPANGGRVPTKSGDKRQEFSPVRRAKVLVMDDEEVIRNISGELLSALGHDVEVAQHGREALEKYRGAIAAGRPFDLVILDLTIRGGMGGLETLQQLLKIDPRVKAVVSSGYSDDAATANYMAQGFKASLKKPYNVAALNDVLNKMLSA